MVATCGGRNEGPGFRAAFAWQSEQADAFGSIEAALDKGDADAALEAFKNSAARSAAIAGGLARKVGSAHRRK